MTAYRIFGRRLEAPFPFPELTPDGAGRERRPDWRLTVDRSGGAPGEPESGEREGARLLGREPVTSETEVRLYRTPAGLELRYDDTGTFAVTPHGEIKWRPGPEPERSAVRTDVLGRVLPVTLHAAGVFCLHGSAVAWGGAAVAFVGPKRHGKSTLAAVLAGRGARLLSDDVIAVTAAPCPLVLPGVASVRLRDDSLALVEGGSRVSKAAGSKQSIRIGGRQSGHPEGGCSLAAVYVIAPAPPEEGGPPVRREPLRETVATATLTAHAKVGRLLGPSEARALLRRAGRIAAGTRAYRLHVHRDLEALDRVAAALEGWHAADEPPPPGLRRREGPDAAAPGPALRPVAGRKAGT